MTKMNMDDLISAFSHGQTPEGQHFRKLIEAAYNPSDILLYDKDGIVDTPIKLYFGETTVTKERGGFVLDYSNVGFTDVFIILTNPVNNGIPTNARDHLMSSSIVSNTLTEAEGRAYVSGDESFGNDVFFNDFAQIGSKINCFVIGK